jgi:hypothetical protein
MTLQPVAKYHKWIQGTAPLPAGAVPLAGESAGLVCIMPSGRWIMWLGGVIHSRPPETQRAVMEIIIGQLGGTAAAVGSALDISPRTVEAWRSGKAPLPIKSAYAIAQALVAL